MKRQQISQAALPEVGQPFAGGFYAGRIYFDGAEHAVIDAGREFEMEAQWWDRTGPRPNIRGAQSYFDGMVNTKAMAEAGSAIAAKVLKMAIRGHSGWHIPAIEELQVLRTNLTQLEDWGRYWPADGEGGPPQAFTQYGYWSSTQRSAGSAWNSGVHIWCTPTTNWATKVMGIRPVRTLRIKADGFIHAPASDAKPAQIDLQGLANVTMVRDMVERYVNEDGGKFYGRLEDLVAELVAIGNRKARHEMAQDENVARENWR